jgi:hypothetical protein
MRANLVVNQNQADKPEKTDIDRTVDFVHCFQKRRTNAQRHRQLLVSTGTVC